MDGNNRYFIALLTAFLKETVPQKPINIDWQMIYQLANSHSLGGAVYVAIQRLALEDQPEQALLRRFKADFFNTMLHYEAQEKAYQEIIQKFNEEKLPHLFFKGIQIREYYPVKQMRTLGDMDFLIHKKDQPTAKALLEQMGYTLTMIHGHWQYKKGKLLLEAHDNIMYRENNKNTNYVTYFENAWEHAMALENTYTYQLNMEYHLVYLITHFGKHFYNTGAGVRMILDIAVILNKFGNSLDFSFVWQELKKINLDIFAQNIFGLCTWWFKVTTPELSIQPENSTFESMAECILSGGTFGRNYVTSILRKEYEKTENRKLAQLKAFIGKIFLNYPEMVKSYPFLRKWPFLLPFAWVARGFTCIFKKRNKTLRILNGLMKNSDKAERYYEMMKKIGLLQGDSTLKTTGLLHRFKTKI